MSGKQSNGETPVWGNRIDRSVNLDIFQCFYANCLLPVDPNITPPPETRPGDAVLFHSSNIWTNSRSDELPGMAVARKTSTQNNDDTSFQAPNGIPESNPDQDIAIAWGT